MFLTQHIQQNYYTPHFNIIWPPICILAAMFMSSVMREGPQSPGVWLLAGLAAVFIGQRIHEAWTLRNDHVPFLLYLEAACIGRALHPVVRRTDTLLAMGIFPSINIYADCPGIPTHLFACMDGKICHEDILVRRLRENPPQWITFYSPTAFCPWDMAHIMKISGQVYTSQVLSVLAEDISQLERYGSSLRQFVVFRLDDALRAVNQCELGREAARIGNMDKARELFTAAADVLPEEMGLRLSLLDLAPDAALQKLHESRQTSPATATFLLAETLTEQGVLPLARKYLSELATMEGSPYVNDPRLHTLRALSRADMPNSAGKRLEMLVHALKLLPFHVPALRAVIALLIEVGQGADAIPLAQNLARLRPDDAQARAWLKELHCGLDQDQVQGQAQNQEKV